jgi:phosphotransferase system  glucose/maltose/N-acetylglucosamine-specific IIC component
MTAWFCFVAVFCLMAVVVGASASSKRDAPFFAGIVAAALVVLAGLALGLVGFAGVRLGKRLSKTDIDQIVEHVKSTFAENVV